MEMFTFFFSSEKLLVLELTPPVEGKKPKLKTGFLQKGVRDSAVFALHEVKQWLGGFYSRTL